MDLCDSHYIIFKIAVNAMINLIRLFGGNRGLVARGLLDMNRHRVLNIETYIAAVSTLE